MQIMALLAFAYLLEVSHLKTRSIKVFLDLTHIELRLRQLSLLEVIIRFIVIRYICGSLLEGWIQKLRMLSKIFKEFVKVLP